MRILKRIAIVAVVMAIPLATTVTAVGAKGKPAPSQGGGRTCAENYGEAEYAAMLATHQVQFTSSGFTFVLNGKADQVCLDVLHGTAGVWEVQVDGNGGTVQLNRILIVPRDSYAPGDSCGGVDLRQVTLPLNQQLPLVIPAGTVNACGTQYGEWINGNLEMTATGEPHPLAFFARMEAKASTASVTVAVTLP